MALEKIHLEVLSQLQSGKRLLCLGYPDMLVTREQLVKFMDPTEIPVLDVSDKLRQWHGWDGPVYDTDAVLRKLGYEPTYADIKKHRGSEIIMDLNMPLPMNMCGTFDVVADFGTLEHCLNWGQAAKNVAWVLADGGTAIHANPLQMTNHGWFSFSPEVYHGLYEEVLLHVVYWGLPGKRTVANLAGLTYDRFDPPSESMQLAVCRKPRADWPLQRKYAA